MQVVQNYQQLFETYRKAHPFKGTPVSLYDPVNYVMDLGGKRLRPAMALMGYGLFQETVEPALPLAYALEIFHNFTLVHDDIMDEAPLRRGKATVHTQFNTNAAILSGDVMLIYAYEYLVQIEQKDRLPEVLRIFNRVAREVCEGQQMDMEFEQRSDVSISEYIRMIELKTAVLIAGSLAIGACAAGASPEDVERVYAFGRHSGIAFQLQDDILDTFGDGAKVGKRIGGDIAQNKKTFLLLKALEVAPDEVRQALLHYYAQPASASKVSAVTQIFESLDLQNLAQAEKQAFQKLAVADLEAIHCPEARKGPLLELADVLINREF